MADTETIYDRFKKEIKDDIKSATKNGKTDIHLAYDNMVLTFAKYGAEPLEPVKEGNIWVTGQK